MPFGEELYVNVGGRSTNLNYGTNEDDIRQKFTGYQKDKETNLDFAEARMYANNFGRFTAVDPLLASGRSANPQTFNRYIYVSGNPLIRTDPTGLDWYRQAIKDSDRFNYQWFDEDPGGDWKGVDFGNSWYYQVPEWNKTGKTAFLYKSGGQDMGEKFWENEATRSFLLGFRTGAQDSGTGTAKGFGNTGINLVNGITGLIWKGTIYGQYAPNPVEIERYKYHSLTEAKHGFGVEGAAFLAPGAAAAPFRGASAFSVVPAESQAAKLPSLIVDYNKYPDLAENIWHAQQAGHPTVLTWQGSSTANRTEALRGIPRILSRDEYPFAATAQGGNGSWVGHIPKWQNDAQGGLMTNFRNANNLQPGDRFRVCVINYSGC